MTHIMENYQTKCSHCQHTFVITQAQLEFKNGLARCGNCKQIFSAKDNLLPTRPVVQEPSPATPPSPPSIPTIDARNLPTIIPVEKIKPSLNKTSNDDFLFDDESGLDGDEEKPALNVSKQDNSDFSLDILDDFDMLPLAQESKKRAPSETHSNSVSSNDTNEEAWLEELLEKEEIATKNRSYLSSSSIEKPDNVTDVSSLLEEFGVEVAHEKALEQPEYQQRLNERFNRQPTAQQLAQKKPFARTLFWGIGCLALLLGLVAQYIIFNQNALMKHPEHAATLHSACDTLKLTCNLPYADIKSVDAKVLSFEGKEATSDIIISLSNHSTQAQVYPNLKLTLQSNNSGVAQVIATPDQYLDDASRALQPQQIKPIKLRVNYPRNKADHLAVDPFY